MFSGCRETNTNTVDLINTCTTSYTSVESIKVSTSLNDLISHESTKVSNTIEPVTSASNYSELNQFSYDDSYEEQIQENLRMLLDAIKNKDKMYFSTNAQFYYTNNDQISSINAYYVEDENGWLYNIELSSYEILYTRATRIFVNAPYDKYNQGIELIVELDIASSNDERFKKGLSYWRFGFLDSEICHYMLPVQSDKGINYGLDRDNPEKDSYKNNLVSISYGFTYAFNTFNTIPDLTYFSDYMSNEYSILQRQLGDYWNIDSYINDYSNIPYAERSNDYFFNQTLGVNFADDSIYFDVLNDLSEDFGGGGDYSQYFYSIDNYTNNYLELTYYADLLCLTPAKKIRYYYDSNGLFPCLTSIELINDNEFDPLKTEI